jgi:hypothetical protein
MPFVWCFLVKLGVAKVQPETPSWGGRNLTLVLTLPPLLMTASELRAAGETSTLKYVADRFLLIISK